MQAWPKLVLAVAGTVAAMGLWAAQAKAAAALWISTPTWSYSAAAADSPIGSVYFWGLSAGPGTYSFAYAFSNDGLGDAGYAFAEAAVGQGGMGAVQVAGFADPYAGESIDIPLTDPSNPSGYPASKPGSDPFSSSYTVTPTGINFTENGQELNGDFELEAFVDKGLTDMASLEADLGVSSDSGTTSTGDVTDFGTLMSDFDLEPLDAPTDDPGSIASLGFTENTGDIDGNMDNVVLIGKATAAPEPASVVLLAGGLIGLGLYWRRRRHAA
jgi:hypothetical protein